MGKQKGKNTAKKKFKESAAYLRKGPRKSNSKRKSKSK